MATWDEISSECFRASRTLLEQGHWRSSISRAYYAVYSGVTGKLVNEGISFSNERQNPAHQQLARYAEHLTILNVRNRRQLKRIIRICYDARLVADYMPGRSIERKDARKACKDALLALKLLGVDNG